MHSFDIILDHKNSLVTVLARGEMLLEDGKKLISAARQAAGDNGYDILYDIRNAFSTINLHEWFYLPRTLDVLINSKTRNVKAAVLFSPTDSLDNYKFYEVVSDNVGLQVRFFLDEKEAFNWLRPK